MLSRETGDAVDAGASVGERRPVVLFALAKRRDDAHAGDCHQGSAEAVGCLHGHFFLPYRIGPKSDPILGSTMRSFHTLEHFPCVQMTQGALSLGDEAHAFKATVADRSGEHS